MYGGHVVPRIRRLGLATLLGPVRAPRANAIAEQAIGTLRRDCLDHLIIRDGRHPGSVLREYVAYSNAYRPHRCPGLEPPRPVAQPSNDPVRSRSVLGGLHHVYECAA